MHCITINLYLLADVDPWIRQRLIVAVKYRPLPILQLLLRLLAPGRPVTIYCAFREVGDYLYIVSDHQVICISNKPLVECLSFLRRHCTDVRLLELMMREYQVLPRRTHPHMRTDASSGFLI